MSESESIVCPNCSERSPAGYILCPYCGFDLTKILRQKQRTGITFKERLSRIWRSLSDPRDSKILFNEIGVNPDRLGVIILLYLVSVSYAISTVGTLVIKGSSSSWHDFHFYYFLISPWFIGIAFFLLALFGWVISTLVVWLIAKTLGGKASLRDTYSIVGYSLGPLITASLVISVVIILLGKPLDVTDTRLTSGYAIFDILYLPFLAICAYHCGNGLQSGHLLNPTYSYLLSGAVAGGYSLLFYIIPTFL